MRGEIASMQDDYNSVLERVFNEVKDRETGVLFTCIGLIDKENSKEIIEYFSISSSASFYDDLQVLRENPSFQPILTKIDPMNIRNFPLMELAKAPVNQNSSFSIGLIIVSALVIIGLWDLLGRDGMVFKQMMKRAGTLANSVKNIGKSQAISAESNIFSDSRQEECRANLCLVVPCERIELSLQRELHPGGLLLPEKVVGLINNSVYFLAEEPESNDISRIRFEDSLEGFPEGSDLFVQLQILDGSNIIGADLKRSLSRAISTKEEITIKKIGLLNDLNNLERFHRA